MSFDGGGGDSLLTVTVMRDAQGYGMKVSGDNPVYVQSVKEHGAAWRAGLRAGDRILRVDGVPVHQHTHQQVVLMIRANPSTVLTVHQNVQRHKTPITAPVPVNSEKQRQLEFSKVSTVRLMLEKDQKYISDLRNELSKVPDVRKQAALEQAEKRCADLQREIDRIATSQPDIATPPTPRPNRSKPEKTGSPPPNMTGFLSGLPRSLSNLTGQSLRNLRQKQKIQQENQPPIMRPNADETRKRHNNTVPIVPTTCLDNSPPPLPPRTIRNPLSPNLTPVNPLAKPKPSSSVSPSHKFYPNYKSSMHQSMPAYKDSPTQFTRSSHSLDGDLDGPQPNSIALQMCYPLVNAPPPPLQMDNRSSVPVMHIRSISSPEHLDHGLPRSSSEDRKEPWCGAPPPASPAPPAPPGTPPPPYAHNTQPCADPQRAIISMEEDEAPVSDNSSYSGLFSNLRSVLESKARIAVLLNWLLGERRCACATLLLLITEGYRSAAGVGNATLRRWAYEIQSTFLMPNAVLQLSGVDENMANEIEHVLANEYDKEEILRNVFRKARQKAKEELTQQLTEFQVKRQVGLGTLYGPEDSVLEKCDVDKAQEQIIVERLMCQRLATVSAGTGGCGARGGAPALAALLHALQAAAHTLHCRPASVAAAVGGNRGSFLQRDKLYKQRVKQLAKQVPQPFVVRGHHLQLQALTSVAHCHLCDLVVWGLAPQAYVCTDCNLRVHRACARSVEEPCCLDGEHHNNRISRFMERIHHNNMPGGQDGSEKKSRKTSASSHFLNMERSVRKLEDDSAWEQGVPPAQERRDESDESLYESADCHSDAISASDDALPRLGKTPTMSKESLKLAVTDEEVDMAKTKKGHRKALSLSNPLEIVKSMEWLDAAKKELEKNSDKKKSRESLWSEEDREFSKSKKEEKNGSKKNSTDQPKSRKSTKGSSVSALNLFRRKKTQVVKSVDAVTEIVDKVLSYEEMLSFTMFFLEAEKRHTSICESKPIIDTDSEEDVPVTPKPNEHRRRLSRQTSRSKSKVRGKSQSVKVNTLRKSHSGTLKKGKKKIVKTPIASRSRQTSVVEMTPLVKKKKSLDYSKQTTWLFSSAKGESRREGSSEEPTAPDADADTTDTKDQPDKDNNWRSVPSTGRGVNRAESCRERDAPRRGKHRNASDPNRLTAHNNHDLEPGATTAPSGSSSSSSLSSRSNESNTVAAEQQASQSDWSEEDEPIAAQWADSLPPTVLDSLLLSSKHRKRQEVIHELIVSEGSHVRWLKVLGMFLKALESQPTLLTPDELKALFPNLPAVRERHSRLYADLKTVRASSHVVQIRPVADALLATLGESNYASCLSHFCRSQRLALDSLRERRRKNKELHQFLTAREQLPLCGRLQLRDLLACVWQRLTKYQLLLENILATVSESDNESEEDIAQLRLALNTAKDVLHSVDTAIRTTENQHRLRSIQNKLEVRASGPEWEELRRLDLTAHNLKMEGDLSIRNDSNKKINVLALFLDDILVLLQREGEKFVLRPITQPSQQGLLSPLIRWDKVLFRPNAAVRNAFFLMNINGVQMHELSTNTTTEYTTWVKNIQEAPLAKLTDLKPGGTPAHQPRVIDEIGTPVSRNPSDASEKSDKEPSAPEESTPESNTRELSVERGVERSSSIRSGVEERRSEDRERHTPRRPTVGRISLHAESSPPLEGPAALTIVPPVGDCVQVAESVCTASERLRRLDNTITSALQEKCDLVAQLVGTTAESLPHLADLATADALGHVDVNRELRATRLDRSSSTEEDAIDYSNVDVHQLLLAAYAQANQLTEHLTSALSVRPPPGPPAPRAPRCAPREPRTPRTAHRACGRCDNCSTSSPGDEIHHNETPSQETFSPPAHNSSRLSADASFDMLTDLGRSVQQDDNTDQESAYALASRLLPINSALRSIVGSLLTALPAITAAREIRCINREKISVRDDEVDQTMKDQPSNGG